MDWPSQRVIGWHFFKSLFCKNFLPQAAEVFVGIPWGPVRHTLPTFRRLAFGVNAALHKGLQPGTAEEREYNAQTRQPQNAAVYFHTSHSLSEQAAVRLVAVRCISRHGKSWFPLLICIKLRFRLLYANLRLPAQLSDSENSKIFI